MLRIRLQRVGRKHIPTFRVVLTDKRNSTKSGRFLEILGNFDPVHKLKTVKEDRIKYWIAQGAQPTDTLHNFLVSKKIIEGKKRAILLKKPAKKEEAPAAAPAAASAAPVEEKAPAVETPAVS